MRGIYFLIRLWFAFPISTWFGFMMLLYLFALTQWKEITEKTAHKIWQFSRRDFVCSSFAITRWYSGVNFSKKFSAAIFFYFSFLLWLAKWEILKNEDLAPGLFLGGGTKTRAKIKDEGPEWAVQRGWLKISIEKKDLLQCGHACVFALSGKTYRDRLIGDPQWRKRTALRPDTSQTIITSDTTPQTDFILSNCNLASVRTLRRRVMFYKRTKNGLCLEWHANRWELWSYNKNTILRRGIQYAWSTVWKKGRKTSHR